MTDLVCGMAVTANVRLVRPLGGGAMGSVWVAEHLGLATEVAVKFIAGSLAERPEARARFEQEARASARIKSPHVVQVFDAGVTEAGTPYLIMELLEGESLGDRISQTGWLSLHQTGEVLVQVAKALDAAHKCGIVHRDIKPDNIFLTPNDDGLFVKVLDFGIARQTELPKTKLTHPGMIVGTPEYMSRDALLSAEMVDYRADLWALAVVAYQMLTGSVPFTGETLAQICLAIVGGEFLPASGARRDAPPALDAWFARAFDREAAKRFSSGREMAAAFLAELPDSDGIADVLESRRHLVPPIAAVMPRRSPSNAAAEPPRKGGATLNMLPPVSATGRVSAVPFAAADSDAKSPASAGSFDAAADTQLIDSQKVSRDSTRESTGNSVSAIPPAEPKRRSSRALAVLAALAIGAAAFAVVHFSARATTGTPTSANPNPSPNPSVNPSPSPSPSPNPTSPPIGVAISPPSATAVSTATALSPPPVPRSASAPAKSAAPPAPPPEPDRSQYGF